MTAARIRIVALDGIRGLLALHIIFGHFLRFASPSEFWMRFFSQVNVTVGAFFALSGYATAYTCTLVGERDTTSSFQSSSAIQWWKSKAMAFYPLHWWVLLIFGPMFVCSDLSAAPSVARGVVTVISNGFLSVTLTQAWFPANHAEIWNAPTWFLSSLSFGNWVLTMTLPSIAKADKYRLRTILIWLYWIDLVPIAGYFVIFRGSLGMVEGMTPPMELPSLEYFNVLRFFPIFNAPETLMGAVASRLVMLDSLSSPRSDEHRGNRSSLSTISTTSIAVAIPLGFTIGILMGRALDWIPDCSDLLVRKLLFVPIFLNIVMALHRSAMSNHPSHSPTNDPVSTILSTRILVWLGSLSFPIYILHGPIGHIFYKRSIATRLWGGILMGKGYFALYLISVVLSAMLAQKLFSKRKIQQACGKIS